MDGIAHAPAAGPGGWLLLIGVLVLVVHQIRRDWNPLQPLLVLLASSAVIPLLAAQFEPSVAVASALRWLSALYLLLVSALIWSRTWRADFGAEVRTR